MSQISLDGPPRFAAWLVDMFAPHEQAESIAGDLLEEYSGVASKLGIAPARRWYWRQSAKSISDFFCSAYSVAPWLTIATTVGGFFLLALTVSLPERAITAVIDFRRHNVIPYYTWQQVQTEAFWLKAVTCMGFFLSPPLVGCVVAMVSKGREMVASMTLSLVYFVSGTIGLVRLATHPPTRRFLLPLLYLFVRPILITTGGAIVRSFRLAATRRPLRA